MAGFAKSYKWIVREALGSNGVKHEKDVLKISAGFTKYRIMPAAASATAIVNAYPIGLGTGSTTIPISSITQPDVQRNLVIKTNTAGSTGYAVITGQNTEGKVITETLALNGTSTVTGSLAFWRVTKIVIPTQVGGGTVTVGTGNKLGLRHRLEPGQYTLRVVLDSTSASTSLNNQTFDAAPTVVTNETNLEQNTFIPVTVPNGALWYRVYYAIFSWSLNNQDENEIYFTSTSTSSTSSSTSTTTITTSTSSTSSSVSSTSTSSTSSSTSSTSTSTTTLP